MNNPRLHIVSGKGGVGKTLIAASLAAAYAARGEKTILISYDEPGRKHPVFGKPMTYEELQVRRNLDLMCMDAQSALIEYFKVNASFSAAYVSLVNNPSVRRFLRALPIFDELIMLGKIYELTTNESSPYDQVVVDGLATGHCKVALQVADVAASTLVAGPIYSNAIKIRDTLNDAELSELIVVTLPEATPVREALELHDFAKDTGLIACNRIVVNRFMESEFEASELEEIEMLSGKGADALALSQAVLLQEAVAQEHAINVENLEQSGASVYRMPEIDEARVASKVKEMSQRLDEALLDD